MSHVSDTLRAAFLARGTAPDPVMLERFEQYHALLVAENAKMDLTNVPESMMPERHYLDSLLPLLIRPALIAGDARVLDVGSGAGFPGLPIAILRPDQPVTLLEANGRRCDFLRRAADRLGLKAVSVLETRAEAAGRAPGTREQFDATVSRAVAGLSELLEYMLPLTRPGGRALCWKGRRAEEEAAGAAEAARILGGATLTRLCYGEGSTEGQLIVAEKTAPTLSVYPRRAGIPHKRPL